MHSPSRKIIAAEVRAAMGRANIKQVELARRTSLSQAGLSDRLSCKRPFSTDQLYEIAEALGVDPLSLMTTPPSVVQESA